MGRPAACHCCPKCPALSPFEPLNNADGRHGIIVHRENTRRTADGFGPAIETPAVLPAYSAVLDHSVEMRERTQHRTLEMSGCFKPVAGFSEIEVIHKPAFGHPFAHGLEVGDVVSVLEPATVGGVTLVNDYSVETIVDSTRFTIRAADAATSDDTFNGITSMRFVMRFTEIEITYTEPPGYYRYRVELPSDFTPYETQAFQQGWIAYSRIRYKHAHAHADLSAALAAGYSRPEQDLNWFRQYVAPVETTSGDVAREYHAESQDCWTQSEFLMGSNPEECRTEPNHGLIDLGTYRPSLFWEFGEHFRTGEEPPAGGTVRRYKFWLSHFSYEVQRNDYHGRNAVSGNFPFTPVPLPSITNPSGGTQEDRDLAALSGHVRGWLTNSDAFDIEITITKPDLFVAVREDNNPINPVILKQIAPGNYSGTLTHSYWRRSGSEADDCKSISRDIYHWQGEVDFGDGLSLFYQYGIGTVHQHEDPFPTLPKLGLTGTKKGLSLLHDAEIVTENFGLTVVDSTTPFATAEDGFLSGGRLWFFGNLYLGGLIGTISVGQR